MEAQLAPRAGFPIEWIEIGGLQGVGLGRALRTVSQLPPSIARSCAILRGRGAAAVFSMGGYVAAPVMMAAMLRGTPMVIMEPNAVPGLVARRMSRFVRRALVAFEEAAAVFPERAQRGLRPARAEGVFRSGRARHERGLHGTADGRQPGFAGSEPHRARVLAAVETHAAGNALDPPERARRSSRRWAEPSPSRAWTAT